MRVPVEVNAEEVSTPKTYKGQHFGCNSSISWVHSLSPTNCSTYSCVTRGIDLCIRAITLDRILYPVEEKFSPQELE